MLEQKEKDALRRSPQLLQTCTQRGVDWYDALCHVASFSDEMGPTLNKYYKQLDDNRRPLAAATIASSKHGNSIIRPDATYLYAWLENAFTKSSAQFIQGMGPDNNCNFSSLNASVLSAWLRADPVLLRSMPFLVASAFGRTGASRHTPFAMDAMLNDVVPRHFRVKRFYPELLRNIATLLIVAAPHIDEKRCLLNMCSRQCQYAAGLRLQWNSVYPGSAIAKDVNQLLCIMQSLETYDPAFLLKGLGLIPTSGFDTITLPANLDML